MSGGRRKGPHVLGMAVLRHWKNACVAASSMSTKGMRAGCAAMSRALAVLCPVQNENVLKKGLMRFDVTMKPQVRGAE